METAKRLRLPTVLMVVSALVAAGTAPRPRHQSRGAEKVDSIQADTPSLDTIKARAASVVFDTILGLADAQPLLIRDGRRYGWAKIEPARKAYDLEEEDLEKGQIVARISSEVDYDALRLGRGTNWWWIDKRGGKWRSVIYSESRKGRAASVLPLDSIIIHPQYEWRQSIARFVFFDTRAALWMVTLKKGCVPLGFFPAWYWDYERANPFSRRGSTH